MKFCFFGHISPAIKGKTKGGAELQIFLLAKSLALNGHQVVIIDPYANESFTTVDGIKLISVPEWKKGLKGLRLFMYRIPALFRIFSEQEADCYYVRMRSFIHLVPFYVSKKRGAKFVQAIASDIDILSSANKYKYEYKSKFKLSKVFSEYLPNDLVFKFLLKKSDYVALQHTKQKFLLKSSTSKQVIFSNIIDLSQIPSNGSPTKNYYIYVGSLTMLKGADNLLKLINSISKAISIVIVGLPKDKEPTKIYEELRKKENVFLKGQVDHKETIQLISNAKALINTSYYEGFPNIYLEAWATGVPVISLTVNPGNIIDKYNLGICCNGDLTKMKKAIECNEIEGIDSENLIRYVNEFHNSSTAAERFLKILDSN